MVHNDLGGSIAMGVPQNGWFMMEHPNLSWMITRGSPISGNLQSEKNMKIVIVCHWVIGSWTNGQVTVMKSSPLRPGMAEDGWLPSCFAHRSRFDTPSLPLLVITILVLATGSNGSWPPVGSKPKLKRSPHEMGTGWVPFVASSFSCALLWFTTRVYSLIPEIGDVWTIEWCERLCMCKGFIEVASL